MCQFPRCAGTDPGVNMRREEKIPVEQDRLEGDAKGGQGTTVVRKVGFRYPERVRQQRAGDAAAVRWRTKPAPPKSPTKLAKKTDKRMPTFSELKRGVASMVKKGGGGV